MRGPGGNHWEFISDDLIRREAHNLLTHTFRSSKAKTTIHFSVPAKQFNFLLYQNLATKSGLE